VASTAALIPVCARCAAIALATPEDLLHALEARNDLFPERRKHDVATEASLELYGVAGGGGRGREEIVDSFIVDLKVGTTEEVFAGGSAADEGENVLHGARDDAGLVVVAAECEGLARGGLAVGKDDGIEAFHGGLHV
jgi:hypothetical protein